MRHGEAKPGPGQSDAQLFSTGDEPLSKRGRRQAQEMGETIARSATSVTSVHTSPAKRSRETAELVAEALPQDHEVVEHEALWEIPYAEPGASYEEILGAIVDTARRLSTEDDPELPTGTTWREATGRFREALEAILEAHQAPLVVAHGAQNRAWLTELLGMPAHQLFFLEQDHACLNVIAYDGPAPHPVVQKLNLTPDPLASQGASLADG